VLNNNSNKTTLTHLIPLCELPATLQAQQFILLSEKLYTRTHARTHARTCAHARTHTHTQNKMSAIHDTKEIKMKIQEPYSECNTKYTAKPCSESVPTFSFVRCPCLTMVVYGHFNNTDLSKLGSDTGSNILNTKVKALYKMYKNHIYRTW